MSHHSFSLSRHLFRFIFVTNTFEKNFMRITIFLWTYCNLRACLHSNMTSLNHHCTTSSINWLYWIWNKDTLRREIVSINIISTEPIYKPFLYRFLVWATELDPQDYCFNQKWSHNWTCILSESISNNEIATIKELSSFSLLVDEWDQHSLRQVSSHSMLSLSSNHSLLFHTLVHLLMSFYLLLYLNRICGQTAVSGSKKKKGSRGKSSCHLANQVKIFMPLS